MWYLTSNNDSRVIYVLPGQDIIIGRNADGQNCNFAVPGDPSLSRKHASLSDGDITLNLQDLGSKYGTFVNNSTDKLESNQKVKLNVNDIVKFGKINCEWKVQKANFVTCTSTFKGENVHNLKNILDKLGGTLKNDWDDSCTYLTMPAITLTIKVVLALVQGSHVVTIDYWNKCCDSISQNLELPDPNNFIPEVVESTLNKECVSFVPNEVRKSLFAGKNIVFFSKRQMEMYKMALEKSSGKTLLLSENKITKSMLCADDVIVIQYNITTVSQETESQREQIKDIVNYLKSKSKRVVADAEIGLAILYCSLDKYCNPDFNFTNEVLKQPGNQDSKVNNILAQESQDTQEVLRQDKIKIDETLTLKDNSLVASSNDESVTNKRKLSEDNVSSNVKKIAIENMNISVNNSGNKRSADELDEMLSNPSKKIAFNSTDNDSFNFIKSSNKSTGSSEKMLNFMKPVKRKFEHQNDDEGLFNFVSKKVATEQNTNNSDSNYKSSIVEDGDNDTEIACVSIASIDEKINLTALRGAKLSELMEQNSKMEIKNECMKIIKSEENDSEEFGSTVVVVRNDLLVKREPLPSKELNETSKLKNFKKFKKVWPLKIQETMSKLSLSAV